MNILSDPGVPGVRSMGPVVSHWLTDWLRNLVADLTDVILADEDTNSILADNAKRAIQGNEAMQVLKWCRLMQVAPSGGQIGNLCMWRHLGTKFAT